MSTTTDWNPPFRSGLGYDIHRLKKGRKLVLGGVSIPSECGLDGHSDADVLSHALADALLGAVGLPDIGHYFPNTDASLAGMDSQDIVRKAAEEVRQHGYAIANVDIAVIAEKPKIAAHIPAMKDILAASLNIPCQAIGIKATTNERIGALGNAEGIAAYATCALWRA